MRLQAMSSFVKKQTNKQTKKQNFHKHLSSTVEESPMIQPEIPNPVEETASPLPIFPEGGERLYAGYKSC